MSDEICEVKRCNNHVSVYYGKKRRGVCTKHYGLHCDKKIDLKKRSTFKGE